MAKKATDRDNEYYLERLRLERPDIHRDLLAGKIASPAAAFKLAGLKKPRTRLQEMKNAWSKAASSERDAFKVFIGCTAPPGAITVPPTAPFSVDRKLSPHAIAQIKAIMLRRGMTMGAVMDELGFIRLNPSLGLALRQNTRMQPDMFEVLRSGLRTILFSARRRLIYAYPRYYRLICHHQRSDNTP